MSILFNKVASLQPKKRLLWGCVIFQNAFLVKHVWVVTGSAKYYFLSCINLISKMLLSTLVMFWLSLNIFRANTVSRLWTAVSGSFRELVDLLLIKQPRDKLKMLLENRSSRPAVFFKNYILWTQVSQESICNGITCVSSCKPSYLSLYVKGRDQRHFSVNIPIRIYLFIVSFQSKLLFLKRSDFRTDQYLLNTPSYFNSWKGCAKIWRQKSYDKRIAGNSCLI